MPVAVDGYKQCCRCKEVKSVVEFNKKNKATDGLMYYCKACQSIEWEKNRDRNNASDRRYYAAHRDQRLAKTERYRYTSKGLTVPKDILDRCAKPKSHRTPTEAREAELARVRQYKQEHREQMHQKYAEYVRSPRGRETSRLRSRKYHTRVRGLTTSLNQYHVLMLLHFQDNKCACCGEMFTEKRKYEIDHVVPVSKGGPLTFDNVQLLCRSCNARKRDHVIRYIPSISEYFSEMT